MSVAAPLLAFNRGEIGKLGLARVDLAKLQLATECQLNWLPYVMGPAMLRPGLQFIGEVAGDNPCLLIDFIYRRSDTALIELTDHLLRVWINDALVTRQSVATAVADSAMAGGAGWDISDTTAGCSVTIGGGSAVLAAAARGGLARMKQTLSIGAPAQGVEHGLTVTVTNGPVTLRIGSADGLGDYLGATALDTGEHRLVFTPAAASAYLQIESLDTWNKSLSKVAITASGVLSLPTAWPAADLSALRWTQSGDIIFVADGNGQQQYKIERRGTRPGARGWSVVVYRSNSGPFLSGPSVNCSLTPSVCEGSGTITSTRELFSASDVGSLLRLFTPGQTNGALLGAADSYTEAVRISGVGTDRQFNWVLSGTWVGTVTLQRSLEGPDAGFVDVGSAAANGTVAQDDAYSNTICWYRVGFKPGDYTSGAAAASFSGTGTAAGGRYGIARVTVYNSPTVVSVEILQPFSAAVPTSDWVQSDWSSARGFPTAVAFQEDRLWWFGGSGLPIAGSQSNNYTGYASQDSLGESLGDAGAILEGFGSGPADAVSWGLPLSRLLIGRESSVDSARSSAFDSPLTPADFIAKTCSQQGAAALAPAKCGARGVFVNSSGSKLYELSFDAGQADYGDRDLTRLNLDIGAVGFVDMAVSTQPDTMLWLPRSDGQVACFLYDRNDDVEAWWRLMTLGAIERVRVLPNAAGGADDNVYFVVNRLIGGVTRRFIEKMAQRGDCVGGALNKQLDSFVVHTGSAVSSITAAHLPNHTLSVWADGALIGSGTTNGTGVLSPLPDGLAHTNIVAGLVGTPVSYFGAATGTVTGLPAQLNGLPGEFFADQQPSGRMVHVGSLVPAGGAVTLPNGWQATKIIGYFGYMAPLMSAKLAYAGEAGSAQQGFTAKFPLNRKKRISHIGLQLFNAGAQSLKFGQSFDALDPLPAMEADAAVASTAVWAEYDQPLIELPGEWDTDARLCLLAQAPLPVTLGAVVVEIDTA